LKLSLEHISSLVLITGMSGAGKSTASAVMSDLGFYVIDNLPVPLFSNFIEYSKSTPEKFTRTALLMDIDSQNKQKEMLALIKRLESEKMRLHLLFLDCRTDVILKRYSETRRPHPNFNPHKDKTLQDTIQRERERLMPFLENASLRIDTSEMTVHALKRELKAFVDSLSQCPEKTTRINFVSFGFKYGIPPDCDLVIDVRFLPNPYFVKGLRDKTGLDTEVKQYVLSSEQAAEFLDRYADLLEFLLPLYVFEGKSYLNIGIGCTGGRHRSVTIAQELYQRINHEDYLVSVQHRDVEK
jgi:RNase adapter protein RapZ